MKIPASWLLKWLPDLPSVDRVVLDLPRLGYEVGAVGSPEEGLAGVTLAEVADRRPHPDSDRLFLVTVRLGGGRFVTVVTAARNGDPGQKLWYGPPGTKLGDGRVLAVERIRDVESPGMLLGREELGYRAVPGEDLWIWSGPEPCGSVWPDVMGEDVVLDLELTPNLAQHAQSVLGVARDLSALYQIALRDDAPVPAWTRQDGWARVEAPASCPHYDLARFHVRPGDLGIGDQRGLKGAGFRVLGGVVDATNYVLMMRGQPLHAFDAAHVRLPIVVRLAAEGEPLTLLDGRVVTLSSQDLVIADAAGPLALAGVMGGLGAAVTEDTRDIFVESAHFTAPGIYRTAKRLGLDTDAALRFGRGTDPMGTGPALAAMAACLEGADMLEGVAGWSREAFAERPDRVVPWDPDRQRAWLGVSWSDATMTGTLRALGFRVEGTTVHVPSWRPDVEGGQDLAEEIGRVRGLDAIDARLPQRSGVTRGDPLMELADRVRDLLAAGGLTEVLPKSLVAPDIEPSLGLGPSVLRVTNPLRPEESVLASSLLPALLATARWNRNRDVERVAIFAVGPVFGGTVDHPESRLQAGALLTLGATRDLHRPTHHTVYDLKGIWEMLWERLRLSGEMRVPTVDAVPAWAHPGRTVVLERDGRIVGVVGEAHPRVTDPWRLGRVALAWLDIAESAPADGIAGRSVQAPSRYPMVRRDLSLAVPPDVSYAALVERVHQAVGGLLAECRAVDRYVAESGESLTFSLAFQASDRTLTEAEVERLMNGLVDDLARIGARRRV